VVAVNPVARADKQLKRTVADLQKVLVKAHHYERVNLLTYLHFSDAFLKVSEPHAHTRTHIRSYGKLSRWQAE
jgi:hypothetical protein